MNGRVPRTKSPARMIAELEALRARGWREMVFIVAANFIGDKPRTRALLREMIQWRRRTGAEMGFLTEASVNLADDAELCALMVEAGFTKVFVGIETPSAEALAECRKMQNRGRIIAADLSSSRLALVGENCRRLGVTIVATLACEGTHLDRCLRGEQFDRVLVDAPCSNTGVLRRRVDLRWRLNKGEIARLGALQAKLIESAAKFAKRGGVLVYSTCSLEPEENEGVVEAFLTSHEKFTVETTRSLFPPRDVVDGAFVARFRRTNAT